MSTVSAAWATVQLEGRTDHGWHVRQIYPGASCDLFAGIHQPDAVPGLLLETFIDHVPAGLTLPRGSGFNVETMMLAGGIAGRVRFALSLTDRSFSGIFAALCEDVAAATAEAPSGRVAVRSWIGRLYAWQAFMAAHGLAGLSENAVAGLIGELLVLRETILPSAGVSAALAMWAGPLGEPNDFTLPSAFVEVKTTSRQVPEVIEIANALQLDDTRGHICLVHVHLRPDPAGFALPDLVSSVRAAISETAPERVVHFNRLLMSAGYLDPQADLYTTRYGIESVEMYTVEGDFPRVRASDIHRGIRNCRYSIELGACRPYLMSADTFSALAGELNLGR